MKHKREKETVTIMTKVERYKVNGKPTCLSWYQKNQCRYCVEHLFKYYCSFTGERLYEGKDKFLEPTENCPVWDRKMENNND